MGSPKPSGVTSCGGVGFLKPVDIMQHGSLIAGQIKNLCIRESFTVESPIIDCILCAQVDKFLCIMEECHFPPFCGGPSEDPGKYWGRGPKIACCNMRLNKKEDGPAQI